MNSISIQYEDDNIMVVEKEAGIPCTSIKKSKRSSLADVLIKIRPTLKATGKCGEAGLVHRLDNDTSGLVLVAKTNDAYEKLRGQFDEGKVVKEYLALVIGNPPAKGTINTPIAHHPRKKKKMVVNPKGRPAETTFKIVKRFGKRYTLLNIQIKTGVRHQIRAHLASIGFPIAGDRLYQNPKKRSEDTLPLKRHFLHAIKLGFTHPGTGKRIEISSDLPKDLEEILRISKTPI